MLAANVRVVTLAFLDQGAVFVGAVGNRCDIELLRFSALPDIEDLVGDRFPVSFERRHAQDHDADVVLARRGPSDRIRVLDLRVLEAVVTVRVPVLHAPTATRIRFVNNLQIDMLVVDHLGPLS